MELLLQYINWPFLFLIIFGGKILTLDEIINPLPFKLKALLIRIGVAWRILVFSAILGLLFYYLEKNGNLISLAITFSIANSMYALLFKSAFGIIESFIRQKMSE